MALNHHIKEKHQNDEVQNAEFLMGNESQEDMFAESQEDMFADSQEDVLGDI